MSDTPLVLPWDLEPSFNKNDIDVVMSKLAKMSHDLRDSINPEYDWSWTYGTKKYGWAINVIEKMVMSKDYPFLGISKLGLGQIFNINGVSVCIVTDSVHNPRKQYRYVASEYEKCQIDLFEEGEEISPKIVWRLILDIPSHNSQFSESPEIALVGIQNGKHIASYIYQSTIFVPSVVHTEQPSILPQEAEIKPVVLSRKKVKTDEENKTGS